MNDDPFVARGRDADPSTEFASTDHHAPAAPDLFTTVGLIGSSAPMMHLRADILRYARSAAPMLITGETGSGKELVARALHLASPRAKQPFVAANCATLGKSDLTASELWGHERGAFTGALTRRRGLFEQAHGGTLFLDEIGELDAATQAGLLRALETGEIRPLGSERTRSVDVRVVAATHRDLAAMVRDGTFREDLYFRLNVLTATLPPLRERRDDIPALAEALLADLAAQHRRGERFTLSPAALAALTAYAWPGNQRELVNVLERAVILAVAPEVTPDLLPEELRVGAPTAIAEDDDTLEAAERRHIASVLAKHATLDAAAKALGVDPSTLYRKRERYGLR